MVMIGRSLKPLVAPSELDGSDLHRVPSASTAKLVAFTDTSIAAMKTIHLWAKGFAGCPHAHLGREGDVCPFLRPSLKKGMLWLTAVEGAATAADAHDAVAAYLTVFKMLEPVGGEESAYKTILVVFPEVTNDGAPAVIDEIQRQLKPDFVAEGLMIGQFYAKCPEIGVHNPEFRPLQSPVPMLVIRNLVPEDIRFLYKTEFFFRSYLDRFGSDHVPASVREVFKKAREVYGV